VGVTEQEKRDWVIEGLKFTLEESGWDADEAYDQELMIQVVTGAIALLKAQEPQMLGLEDVRQYAKEGRPFYLEFANGSFGWTVPTNYSQSSFEHGTGETPLLRQFFSYYNTIIPGKEFMAFRCWNTTPTEAQMEGEKWQSNR